MVKLKKKKMKQVMPVSEMKDFIPADGSITDADNTDMKNEKSGFVTPMFLQDGTAKDVLTFPDAVFNTITENVDKGEMNALYSKDSNRAYAMSYIKNKKILAAQAIKSQYDFIIKNEIMNARNVIFEYISASIKSLGLENVSAQDFVVFRGALIDRYIPKRCFNIRFNAICREYPNDLQIDEINEDTTNIVLNDIDLNIVPYIMVGEFDIESDIIRNFIYKNSCCPDKAFFSLVDKVLTYNLLCAKDNISKCTLMHVGNEAIAVKACYPDVSVSNNNDYGYDEEF